MAGSGFWRSWPGKLLLVAVTVAALYFLSNYLHALAKARMLNPYYFRIVMLIGISIILSVSLNLVNGVTGQFSIGHAGFMALGAYTGAAFTVYGQYHLFPPLE